jgi:uncharacterized protein YecE (DUF72 family)
MASARGGRAKKGEGAAKKSPTASPHARVDVSVVPAPDPEREKRAHELAQHAPVPARVGSVAVGTAGWTDPSLVKLGNFYPPGSSKPEERLKFYAAHFPMVELDASYYALPTPQNAQRWVERTPPDFVFDVKAYAALTEHPFEAARLPKDLHAMIDEAWIVRGRVNPKKLPEEIVDEIWSRFRIAIEPLHAAKKLGAVLMQYPPWFTATKGNSKILERARERLGDLPAAVEFRHASWGAPGRLARVVDYLRELRFSFVVVDEPQGLPNSMPPTVAVADPSLAIVRFHGHRRENWNESVSVHAKFGYLYDPDELKPWVPKVEQLAASADRVHLVFNNCFSNYAVVGAKDLAAMLAATDPATERGRC